MSRINRSAKISKEKVVALCKSFLWSVCILLFPIISGTLSVILSLELIETLFLQGSFMLVSLVIPLVFVLIGKWKWNEIGFDKYDIKCSKRAYHFLPLITILIPVAVQGFYFKSAAYVFGNLFLYSAVGIAEEVYFRGIIPKCLNKAFTHKGVVLFSTAIFGIGHIATAFTMNNGLEVFLTVLNAFIFGWLAIEVAVISKNIVPIILLHSMFDFETKIVVISGNELLTAECIRGAIIVVIAVWLGIVANENRPETKEIV